MAFDLKSFAAQVRPSQKRKSPEPFDNSVFDAGSPQYVRPEDLLLDIQAQLFEVKRCKSKEDLGGLHHADFGKRWLRFGAANLHLQRVGEIRDESLAAALMNLLRCPRRKRQEHPVLLPAIPALTFYKNITHNLPNFWGDQLRPALSFADEGSFVQRVSTLKDRLCNGAQPDDSLKQLAAALLPPLTPRGPIRVNDGQVLPHNGPLLRDFTATPSRPLRVCDSLREAVDSLIDLEATLPRLLWSRWFTATLRLWLPLFFLKRCAVTAAAAQGLKLVLTGANPPNAAALTTSLFGSNGILRGSKDWLNQLTPIIQSYVRARFEISIVLELVNLHERLRLSGGGLDPTNAADRTRIGQELDVFEVDLRSPNIQPFLPAPGVLENVRLSMPGDNSSPPQGGWRKLPFDGLLGWISANRQRLDALARIIGGDSTADLVEKVYAYIRPDYEPLKKGFTKNLREFVAYNLGAPLKADRDPEFPDEFNLIYRGERGRRARQVMVQPGPQLLTLLVQLVSHQARAKYQTTAKLSDLLDLFDALGVDFRSNPDDFESLKSELLRLGLLQSSADAAEAASLNPAYSF